MDLTNFKTNNVTDMSYMFYNCSSLTNINLSNFKTSAVVNMSYMFYNCSSLTKLDLSKFNTTNVKDMRFMFNECSKLTNLNLSNFNTKKVINMSSMFAYCFQNNATLICTASTIKKIADDGGSCLIIPNENENNDWIKNTLTNEDNQDTVYTCNIEIVAESKEEDKEEKKDIKQESEGINTNKKEKKQEEGVEEEYVKHKIIEIEEFIKEKEKENVN